MNKSLNKSVEQCYIGQGQQAGQNETIEVKEGTETGWYQYGEVGARDYEM